MNKQGTPDTNTGVTTASLATTATPAVPLFRVFLIFMLIAGFPGLFAQDQKEIEKYFKMDIRELLQVDIVTAGKTVEKIAEIPAAVVLVTREDIENYGYSSLVELLENIPGLYCTKDYGYVNFGVRGFWTEASNRNMIILVNGVSQVDHRMSAYYIRQINVPVESIDRIEVIKGPMSVIYGSGAFFGVINIITNEVVTEKKDTPGLLSVSTGTAKTGKLFARLSGKEGEFRYVFNASHYGSYGLDVAYEALGYPSELSSGGRLEKKDTYFNVSASLREFSFDVSYTANRNESMFAFPAVLDGSDSFESATRLSFKYKKRFSGVFTLEAKLKYYDVKITDKYDSLFEGYFAVQDESSAAFEVEANLFITPVGGFNITVGLNYLNVFEVLNSFDVPFFGAANRRNILDKGNAIETKSIFTQVNYELSRQLTIVAGARIEQMPAYTIKGILNGGLQNESTLLGRYDYSKVGFIPRLALIYTPNKKHVIKFLYGKAINRPSFFQNRDFVFVPGSTQLEPETLQTLELNYTGSLSSTFTLGVSVFRNVLDKLIYRSVFFNDGVYRTHNANVGEMVSKGVELSVNTAFSETFRLELNVMYQDTEDQRAGFQDIEVGYSPRWLGYFKASYFIDKNISLAVTGRFVDEMQAYWDDTREPPGRLGEKVDSYFDFGANLRVRKLFGTGLFLNVRCSNLLDKEIRFPATSNNFRYAPLGSIGMGRSFLVTLGWRF